MKKACAIGWLLSLAISFAPSLALAEARCAHHDPLRQPFYGDTHVHTALSFDAWGQGTLATPDDAYRFAKGEAIGFQPYDADGNPQSQAQLRRPLDYAVVTDHSDLLGETRICSDPAASGHDSLVCRVVRRFPKLGYMLVNGHVHSNENPERYSFCGEAGERCLEAAGGPWREIQEAAATHLDQSNACGFTTFVGYEWTGMPGGNNIHRNVIFANDIVQARPTTYTETPTQEGLWEALRSECLDAPPAVPGGARCDVLAIPHNSNVSGGRMFTIARADGTPISADDAATRARLERLVEVTQHKGDSECRPGAADELCEYETLGFPRMMDMLGSVGDVPEIPPRVYVREVLGEGLLQTERLGVNPFQYGIVGATDTHFGTPGMVDEDAYRGHAAGSVAARFGVPAYPDRSDFNPGGLGVLWAEENSRASLFAAMKRREVYGTSGPRIQVRFFGGFELSEAICSAPDFAARGYAGGVPMGGTLGPNQAGGDRSLSPGDTAPRFAIQALRDPGGGGVPTTALQRIQVVKGWLEEGVVKERVFDVAGDPVSPASVDLGTCTPRGAGFDQLCSIWTDPDFDPEAHAFYYARVIENPSCRWNAWTCLRAGVSCNDPASVPGELAACCDPSVPRTIQERAWTSPIWYVPGPAG
ncbi:MAG: DUF3604 domain-containing protein [Myxococcota bacterium]